MAEIVTIEGQEFKKRNIWAVWLGLPIITLGIYRFVWYHKVNDEARRYLRDDSIRPGISVLAITLGLLLLVPPFVSIYRTGERVRRMQENAGVEGKIEPVLALIAAFIASLDVLYIQANLNKVWDLYLGTPAAGGQPLSGPSSAPPTVPPPPPAPEMPPAQPTGDAGTE